MMIPIMRLSLVLLSPVVILAACADVSVYTPRTSENQAPAGVSNYTRVDATVACGGATEVAALRGLKDQGFVSVVNLRLADERGANVPESMAEAQAAGLQYFHLPFSGSSPDPAIVGQFLDVVADPANQPVYVHCGSANRVGAVWLVKRVLQDGWTIEQATAEAKAIGLSSAALEAFALDYIAAQQ